MSKQSLATTKKTTFSKQELTEIHKQIYHKIIDFRSLLGTFCAPGAPLGRIWQPRVDRVNSGDHFYTISDGFEDPLGIPLGHFAPPQNEKSQVLRRPFAGSGQGLQKS